eukprot:2757725-Pyramimonas_sp.AAC.1
MAQAPNAQANAGATATNAKRCARPAATAPARPPAPHPISSLGAAPPGGGPRPWFCWIVAHGAAPTPWQGHLGSDCPQGRLRAGLPAPMASSKA